MQIDRVRGDTYADVFRVTQSSGELADLTGASLLMTLNTLKNPPDDTTQVYQLVGQVANPLSGEVSFIPSAVQADRVGLFYYDVQFVDSSGVKRTLVKDVYNYIEDITKN